MELFVSLSEKYFLRQLLHSMCSFGDELLPLYKPHFNYYWLNFIKQEKTPLSHAAGCGHLDIVKYLVEKGADIDKFDNDVGTHWCYSVVLIV